MASLSICHLELVVWDGNRVKSCVRGSTGMVHTLLKVYMTIFIRKHDIMVNVIVITIYIS